MENGQTKSEESAEVTQWPVPAGVKSVLQKLVAEQQNLLLSIGTLEADYLAQKERLLRDLGNRKQRWQTTLDEAARAGGLDIDKERWVLDDKTQALVRQP